MFSSSGVNGLGAVRRRNSRVASLREQLRRAIFASVSTLLGRKLSQAESVEESIEEMEAGIKFDRGNILNRQALKQALEQLPLGYRVIFGMHDIYGYKHEEIAGRLGISISASKSHLHDARLQLRT